MTPKSKLDIYHKMLGEVGMAAAGTRNETLNRASYTIGGMVADGIIGIEQARHDLEGAALAAGLTKIESAATIKSGLESGMLKPLSVSARMQPNTTRPAPISKAVLDADNTPARAAEIWEKARKIDIHAYAQAKKIPTEGLRQSESGALIIPMYSTDGELVCIQRRVKDGDRWVGKFPSGTKPSLYPDAHYRIGDIVAGNAIYVAEGIGAAAAIHRITDCPAVVAFGKGRLTGVTQAIAAAYPDASKVIVVADAGVEGHKAAMDAAKAANVWVMLPDGAVNAGFDDIAEEIGDFAAAELLLRRCGPWEEFAGTPEDEPRKEILIEIVPAGLLEMQQANPHPRALIEGLLYADVRARYATGGVGKTTLALLEMIRAALGLKVWGFEPEKPLKSVFFSREDSREMLLARMFRLCKGLELRDDEIERVGQMVRICDMSDFAGFRLSQIRDDVVEPNKAALAHIIDSVGHFGADWIVMDPLVSFGVGENRVNDAMQGIIESCRIVRNALDICVELIHHVGKQAATEGRTDQHAGRGGSALSDGCRMVVSMAVMKPVDFQKETGTALDGRQGIKLELSKLSFAPQQDPFYIVRDGWRFDSVVAQQQTGQERADANVERLAALLSQEKAVGKKITFRGIRARRDELGMSDNMFLAAWEMMLANDRLIKKGERRGAHFEFQETQSKDDENQAF